MAQAFGAGYRTAIASGLAKPVRPPLSSRPRSVLIAALDAGLRRFDEVMRQPSNHQYGGVAAGR